MEKAFRKNVMASILVFGIGMMWGNEANAGKLCHHLDKGLVQGFNRLKDKQDYIERAEARSECLKKYFEEREREIDSFGLIMNPVKLPPVLPPTNDEKEIEYRLVTAGPLQEAVNSFKPNLISAKKQIVIVGSRSFELGDNVQLKHNGLPFNLSIVKIADNELEFIDANSQQRAIKVVAMQHAVNRFKPTLISASKQMVMVGSRSLGVGDDVQIECEGVFFNLRIAKIAISKVEFINTENQERAIAYQNGFGATIVEGKSGNLIKRIRDEGSVLIIK